MNFGDTPLALRRAPFRTYVAVSLALHAALGGTLYWFGAYQVEQRRQDTQVADSAQATYRARTVRRVDDLQKIKELMAQSTRSEPGPDAALTALPPVSDDPREQLARARVLSKAIDDIHRDIRAEELARLTGMSKEAARAEVDAEMPSTTPAPPEAGNPADEIAGLEEHARELLARRADDLRRKQEGVAVSASGPHGEAPNAPLPVGAEGGSGNAEARAATGPATGLDGADERSGANGHDRQSGQAGQDRAGAGTHAADRIDDFLGQGVDATRAPRHRSTVGRLIRYGSGRIPGVGTGPVTKGEGRMLGAGGQYADRIHLNSWYLIGPFPGRRDRGTAKTPVYPPEQAVLLDAVYRGKDQQLLRWEYVPGMAYPLIPREPVEDAVYYGYTEVLMDEERELMVWLGVDDDATVYLNDRIMWKSDDSNKGWFFDSVYRNRRGYDAGFNRTERRMLVRFKKGRNRIFLKLWNDTNEMFFSMVLTLPGQAKPE
ncbi:hypothetical protein OU994_14005 [Pseudoduganella sp. SL102]|uniref:hypothetical protein n=1 Tax=Pseudoduganella sp. SL102 TaxID=2995154 RepID=UPI00248BCCC8|nr:hypothetical protein [Pseudoduganella sp. SL102]WBS05307.1 hypothetical protein OU994_14005 [Pseudoduganella sp. SL102]